MMSAVCNLIARLLSTVPENIPIPFGENKTIWELITGPYTKWLGPFFYAIMISVVAGLIWIKTQNVGPTLIWFIAANGVMSALVSGDVQFFFSILAVLGLVALFYRAFTR